ncbi:MAG: DNA repair protein RadA, partial [Oscillospiraceae bacterium]|nr:DNA repair protein RadA [Oscillospiraceae bacterium]
GSTNEIGVFEMTESGLRAVDNPSELMLSGRPENVPGTCVTCLMEGSRPILAEIQALMAPTGQTNARRHFNGVEFNRTMMLLAVLEKRAGLRTGSCDAYVNVTGGISVSEPGCDLAVILAVASSYRDVAIGSRVAAVGEVGLTGELRSVTAMSQRLREIARLGFTQCVVPAGAKITQIPEGLEIVRAKSVRDAILLFCQ